MIVITTPADLRRAADNLQLPPSLIDTVEDWYWACWRAAGGNDPESFTLADTGAIIILETDDPPEALPGGGQKITEWCDRVDIGGADYYDAGILAGNTCCHRVLGRAGVLHPAVEAYLAREAIGAR